jgi:chaperonin GroES
LKLRPLGDRIVVERLASKEYSTGGIYLPDSVQQTERPQLGLVLAVGPGKKLEWTYESGTPYGANVARQPMDVSVGDLVLFTKYSGHSQRIDGSAEVLVFSEADVLCVVDQELDGDGTATEGN